MPENHTNVPYFAYGAEMHPLAMTNIAPTADLKGIAMLPKFRLTFSMTGPGRESCCNIEKTMNLSDRVYGALYLITGEDLEKLELNMHKYHEVKRCKLTVMSYRQPIKVMSFFSDNILLADENPLLSWYKQMVLMGALFFQFPETYIKHIQRQKGQMDTDSDRRKVKEELLNKVVEYVG